MMLLTVVLAPFSLAVLFIVMSWTERALDHQPTGRVIPTALGAALRGKRSAAEPSVLIDQASDQ
jgi:hypothetical protein